MNYQIENYQESSPIYNYIKINKIIRNKFKQGGERLSGIYKNLMKEIEDTTNK